MIQRRCRAMIVQDDSEVSVVDGNIEQAEDGNKVELTGYFSTALRGSLYCNFAITNV